MNQSIPHSVKPGFSFKLNLAIKKALTAVKLSGAYKYAGIIFFFLYSSLTYGQNSTEQPKIKFTKFSISTDKKKIAIDWATDASVPTNYFEIQKSLDGVNFKTIALVLGPDPKQSTCDCYGCFDKYVRKKAKHSYYRLKHVDTNGEEQVSEAKLLAKI